MHHAAPTRGARPVPGGLRPAAGAGLLGVAARRRDPARPRYSLDAVALLAGVVAMLAVIAVSAAVGVGLAAFTVVFKRGGAIAGLVAAVVALLAGVYFSVRQLPGVVRWAAEALQFTWGITALRNCLLFGEVDTAQAPGGDGDLRGAASCLTVCAPAR